MSTRKFDKKKFKPGEFVELPFELNLGDEDEALNWLDTELGRPFVSVEIPQR